MVEWCLIPDRPEFAEEVEELLWSDVIAAVHGQPACLGRHVRVERDAYLRFFTNKALSTITSGQQDVRYMQRTAGAGGPRWPAWTGWSGDGAESGGRETHRLTSGASLPARLIS